MNPVQLHMLFNHLPVVGGWIGLAILIAGLLRKSEAVRRTGLVVLAFAGLFAIPASKSGEASEKVMEEWSGVSHELIHEHEEAAEWATPLMVVSGLLAIVALFWKQRSAMVSWAAVAVGLFGGVAMMRTAHLGGMIRHPELTQSAPLPVQIDPGQTESPVEDETEHDD
ncbi:hypothetical protein GC167_05220 [bacterium]|nr:hypothetical protein [bacterium]